jgi:hypothetical protein
LCVTIALDVCDTEFREATFQLVNGVALKGGYAGVGAKDPHDRDTELYETVLSGDLIGNDGPDFLDNGENSYHVVTGSGTDLSTVLDGFTIRGGHANGPVWPEYGSIGAGIIIDAGSPTVANCLVTGNLALEAAGGMENLYGSSPTVSNTIFAGNAAGILGGGMENYSDSNPTITNCTFDNNTAAIRGGGMYNGSNSNPTVTNCAFTANTTGQAGAGGMGNAYSSPTVEDCTFTGNSALLGGGMENFNSSPTIANCQFIDNIATQGQYGGGGMLSSTNSSTSITNCTFCGNSAELGAGGGMFTTINSMTTITNCTFTGNSAVFGGGMHTSDQGGRPGRRSQRDLGGQHHCLGQHSRPDQ